MVAEDERARDLVQDVFIAAWRQAQRNEPPFEPGREADAQGLRRWLFHDAYWRAISALRRDRRVSWEPLVAEESSDVAYADDVTPFEDRIVEAEVLRAALATLAPQDAACVLLSVVEGLRAAEVAEVLGIATEAAKKRISRAKQRLRAAYFQQNPAGGGAHRP
jgi:RNA polymerase sigma-70 factor (ECF subfamily)